MMEISEQEMSIIYETVARSRTRSYSLHDEYPILLRALSLTLENRDQIFEYKKIANSIKLLLDWSNIDLPIDATLDEKLDYIYDSANSLNYSTATAFRSFYLANNALVKWRMTYNLKQADSFKRDMKNSVHLILKLETMENIASNHYDSNLLKISLNSWNRNLELSQAFKSFHSSRSKSQKFEIFSKWLNLKKSSILLN